jgi:hypothetical protein
MRKLASAALFAACFATAPTAFAGDFFINGQMGRMELDADGFDDDESSLMQASAGYRWASAWPRLALRPAWASWANWKTNPASTIRAATSTTATR